MFLTSYRFQTSLQVFLCSFYSHLNKTLNQNGSSLYPNQNHIFAIRLSIAIGVTVDKSKNPKILSGKLNLPRIVYQQQEIDAEIWHFPLVLAVLAFILRVSNQETCRNFLAKPVQRFRSCDISCDEQMTPVYQYVPPVRVIENKKVI